MVESEHDQVVRLNERVKIFKEYISSQYHKSDLDELSAWEEFSNEITKKIEDKFDFIFDIKKVVT